MNYAILLAVSLFMAYTPEASAWQWNDVQRWAQEVEDRADDVYEQALSESRQNYADEEYALELLWQLTTKADHFSDRVDFYPWGNSVQTRNDFHQLYTAYYRAQQALQNTNFSYHVDEDFRQLGWAMQSLRREYLYEYRHDGWRFHYHRDHWYITLGHRHYHRRSYYRNILRDRYHRRLLRRDRWERRWRNDRRYRRIDRNWRRAERRDRGRVDRDRRDRGRVDRDRRDRGRVDRDRRDRRRVDRDRRDRGRVDRDRRDRGRVDRDRRDRGRVDRGRRDRGRVDRDRRDRGGREGRRPRNRG